MEHLLFWSKCSLIIKLVLNHKTFPCNLASQKLLIWIHTGRFSNQDISCGENFCDITAFHCPCRKGYNKYSRILNTFLFLFSKCWFQGWYSQNTVRIANMRTLMLLQKQSDLVLHCLSRPFWQATYSLNFLEHLPDYLYMSIWTQVLFVCVSTVKPVFSGHSKEDQKLVFNSNYS